MELVVLVEYDSSWSESFEQEASHLRHTFGSQLLPRSEHIGSTAIVSMPAKPIIDLKGGNS